MERGSASVVEVSVLSTTELCQLWRATYWLVREHESPVHVCRLVELRRNILDELEARHPEAVKQWLNSTRHLADGPARYL